MSRLSSLVLLCFKAQFIPILCLRGVCWLKFRELAESFSCKTVSANENHILAFLKEFFFFFVVSSVMRSALSFFLKYFNNLLGSVSLEKIGGERNEIDGSALFNCSQTWWTLHPQSVLSLHGWEEAVTVQWCVAYARQVEKGWWTLLLFLSSGDISFDLTPTELIDIPIELTGLHFLFVSFIFTVEPVDAEKVDVVIIFSKNCIVAYQWINYLTEVLNNIFSNQERPPTR